MEHLGSAHTPADLAALFETARDEIRPGQGRGLVATALSDAFGPREVGGWQDDAMLKWNRFNWSAIGALATVLGVVVALLAWWSPRAAPGSGAPSSPVSHAPFQITKAPSKSASFTEAPSPTTSAPNSSAPVRHEGTVMLAIEGDAIDLNSPANDPTWGVSESADRDDMVRYNYALGYYLELIGVEIARMQSASNYQACRVATNYASLSMDRIEMDDIPDTPRLCLRLSSGRYAALHKVKRTADSATIGLTVWELPD